MTGGKVSFANSRRARDKATAGDDWIPPHNIDVEQAVLGGLMLDNRAWATIVGRLTSEDFYRRDHQIIFHAMTELATSGEPFDAVIIADWLHRHGHAVDTGGLVYLVNVTRETPSAANVSVYADAIRACSTLRKLRTTAERIIATTAATEGRPPLELVADAIAALSTIGAQSRIGTGLVDSGCLVREMVDDLDRRREGTHGLRVGLSDFDALTMGLEGGDLVVIAGRPGMGKTALLVTIAGHVSQTLPVAVFSAEMPAQQLMRRVIAGLSGVPQGLLRHAHRLSDEHWSTIDPALREAAGRRLWIDETAQPSLVHIRAEVMALRAKEPLALVVVDYVQLLRGTGGNRYEQLRDIAYGMKALAKELNLPIIVLAQLNRGVESREQKRPHISDLRDSGAIEEAADIIGLLYSDGYYDRQHATPDVLECEIAKNRNGERGECLWRFEGAYSRITVLDDDARALYRQVRAKHQYARVDL